MDALPARIQTFAELIEHLDGHAEQPLDLESGLRQLMARNPEAEHEAGALWYWELAAGAMMPVSSDERLREGHGQRDLAIAATQALQALGPEVVKSLKRFSQTIEVPTEGMDRFIGHFIQGDLGAALGRLAVNMIPKWDYVVKQAHDLAQQNPFTSLVPRDLLDGMGWTMVHMPSFETSPEVHYPMAFGEWIQFEAGFIHIGVHRQSFPAILY